MTRERMAEERYAWLSVWSEEHDLSPDELGELFDECDRARLAEADLRRALEVAERERDEARDWVRKMVRETQELRCAFCGETYPPGIPGHNDDALTAHVRVCAKHPMRELEHRLAGIVALLGTCGECGLPPTRIDSDNAVWCEEHSNGYGRPLPSPSATEAPGEVGEKGGWIAVGERLPEFGVDVLAWKSGPLVAQFQEWERDGVGTCTGYWTDIYGEDIDDLTHWQPISPPGAGKGGGG